MTGWGQDGPYAPAAGHDINYISLAGALAHFGRAGEAPVPPLNMVGDFGGGGMFLAFGVVCALLEAQRSGKGQVVDTAMVDGAAVLMSMFWAFTRDGACSTRTAAAPTCSTPAPTSTTSTGAPTASTSRSARSSRSSTPSCCASPASTDDPEFAEADGPERSGRTLKQRLAELFAHEDPRRVVRADGAHRRLLRAGAHDERGGASTRTTSPASTFVEVDGVAPAGAGAALQPHQRRRSRGRRRTPASTPARCSPTGAFDAPIADRRAGRSRAAVEAATCMGTLVCLPRPSRRRGDQPPAARWRAPPPRGTGSCS